MIDGKRYQALPGFSNFKLKGPVPPIDYIIGGALRLLPFLITLKTKFNLNLAVETKKALKLVHVNSNSLVAFLLSTSNLK